MIKGAEYLGLASPEAAMGTLASKSGGKGGGGKANKGEGKAKHYRQYVKGQFAKMAGGGDLVSDVEKRAMDKEKQEVVDQTLGAQQRLIERQVSSHTGGDPVAKGALVDAAQQVGGVGAGQAVKITGENKRFTQALREKRAGEALAAYERLHDRKRENVTNAVKFGLKSAEIGAEIFSMFGK